VQGKSFFLKIRQFLLIFENCNILFPMVFKRLQYSQWKRIIFENFRIFRNSVFSVLKKQHSQPTSVFIVDFNTEHTEIRKARKFMAKIF